MVMRTLEIKEITYAVDKRNKTSIVSKLKKLYRDELEILVKGNEVTVKGDLHNYRRRERIIWILSGGKHGTDIQAN
jgi:hypothetical protein